MLNVEKKVPRIYPMSIHGCFFFIFLLVLKRREWMGPDGLLGVAGMMIDS